MRLLIFEVEMFRTGIIGYGKMGRLRHEKCLALGGLEVVSVFDPFTSDITSSSGAKVCDSAEAILMDPSIEVVFIATVNAYIKDLTIAALRAGKHVFCEKPPALNAHEMREIMAVEKATDRVLMYGFNHRQHGAALQMHDIVISGQYGRILWMRGRYGKSVDTDYLDTWRANPKLSGGGILIDQGIHMLDLFLYLGGSFDEVQAMVSSLYWQIEGVEDNVFAILRNSTTGRVASLHSTMTQWRHLFSLEVFMERGYMVLNGLKTSSDSYGQEKLVVVKNRSKVPAATWEEEEEFLYEIDTSWETEMKIFRSALQTGAPITTGSSQDALKVMELVDRIYANERHTSTNLYRDLNALASCPPSLSA